MITETEARIRIRSAVEEYMEETGLSMAKISKAEGWNENQLSYAVRRTPHIAVLSFGNLIDFDTEVIEWAKEQRRLSGNKQLSNRQPQQAQVYPIAYQRWAA